MDMKYIISEEQLILITEQGSEENLGKVVYVTVKVPKPSEILKKTNLGSSTVKYTPEGYPIPTKPFDGYSFAITSAEGTILLYSNVENSDPSNRTTTGYEGPDGEIYIPSFTNDNNIIYLMHLDKSLVENVQDASFLIEDSPDLIYPYYWGYKDGRRKKMKLAYFNKGGQNVYEMEIG